MKRVFLLTLLLILLIFLAGCDNGSAPDSGVSKSSELVNVCLSIEGDSSEMQKTSSLNGLSFTYQFKAIPQWSSDNIHGTTSEWTTINYSENMSIGYFTPGQWIFYIRMLGGSTPVYEGHSDIITIRSSQAAAVTVSVTRILPDAEWGAVRINITAPTVDENTDSLTISWGNDPEDSAVADKSPAGSITTFSKTIKGLSAGNYTFTLTYNNSETRNESITVAEHQMTLITGQFDGSGWDLEKTTLQFHDINVIRYDYNQGAGIPLYYGTVDMDVDSAVPGERVYFSPRPVVTSSVETLSVTSNGQPVTTLTGDTDLYSFIMPEQDVTINIKFARGQATGVVDLFIFRIIVQALYVENHNSVRYFGRSDHAPGAGDKPVTLGDVKVWYDSSANKVCWHSDYEKMQLSAGSMAELFKDCDRYESISLNGIIASDVNNMASMFQGCTGLEEVDLSNFNASGTTSMANMFRGCTNLETLTLTGFTPNTTSGVNMANMFNGCENLESLDLTNFNGTSATNMEGMFKDCERLSGTLDFTGIVASNSTSMASMFEGCADLEEVDLTNFNASSSSSLANMFRGCTSLSSLTLTGLTPNTTSGVNMANMFNGCRALASLDITKFNGTSATNMESMFKDCELLSGTMDFTGIVASNSTSMASMFEGCADLEEVDLTNFNASSSSSLANMFRGCTSLSSLTLTGFTVNSTSPVDMASMFRDCVSLTGTLDLSSFNTTQATDMSYMFCACRGLTGITFGSNFKTGNVTDMTCMFSSLATAQEYPPAMNLTSLNVSNFDTSKVTSMRQMFYLCYNLTTLNVSGFDTSKVTDMSYMFACYNYQSQLGSSLYPGKIQELNLSGWDFTNVKTTRNMFDRQQQLSTLTFPSTTNFASLTTMAYMFSHCLAMSTTTFRTIVGSWKFSGQGDDYLEKVYGIGLADGSTLQKKTLFGNYESSNAGQNAGANYIFRNTMTNQGKTFEIRDSYTTKDNIPLYIGGYTYDKNGNPTSPDKFARLTIKDILP